MAGVKGKSGRRKGYKSSGWRFRDPAHVIAIYYGNLLNQFRAYHGHDPSEKVRTALVKTARAHTVLLVGESARTVSIERVKAIARRRARTAARDPREAVRVASKHWRRLIPILTIGD